MLDLLRYTALTYGSLLAVFSLLALVAPGQRIGRTERWSAPARHR